VGDIKPEIVLGPAEIQSYGVSSLADLLNEIAPQTRSERGRGGEQPVILLAGRRISGFQEIRDIPPEAILRVDILPEEAALKYGYSANPRVVNIVLRPFFRATTAEGGVGYATEGGQPGGSAELGYLRIRRDQRRNIDLKVSGQPRHEVEAQAGLLKNGYGLRLSADWKRGTSVNDPSSPLGDLTFSDIAKVDIRLFADLGARRDLVAKYPFFRGARLALALTNVFDQGIPISYQPAYLDPVGRKISVSFREMFLPPLPAVPPPRPRPAT
jgi:outer membrane receptor protein involved in Fe transport